MVRNIAMFVIVASIFAGCGWKSDGMERIRGLYDTPSQEDDTNAPDVDEDVYDGFVDLTVTEAGGDVQENDFWGYYTMKMTLSGTMELFPGFDPYDLLLTNYFVASWSDDGLELTFCHQTAELDADGLGATVMIPETEAAIGQSMIVLETGDGTGILPQTVAWTWGIQGMTDPTSDPLPTTSDDPLVWDQDEDGHPGISIEVLQPEGYRYMVRRSVWYLTAPTVSQDGRQLSDTFSFKVHEGAVGYDGPNALKTLIPIVPNENGGEYVMKRTDEYLSCADALSAMGVK